MVPQPLPPLAVIGGGLCGGLAALALARRGFATLQVAPQGAPAAATGEPASATATDLSYGALAGPGSWQAWADLERLHGPLGLRPATLLHHSAGWLERLPAGLRAAPTRLWGLGRVDTPTLLQALPPALAQAGVRTIDARVRGLEPTRGGWRLRLETAADGAADLELPLVVLAAGAACRDLWPALPERLRVSWAGVLLPADGPPTRWTGEARRGRVVQPRRWRRPWLEARALALAAEDWIVDAGVAPRDRGLVIGQITLLRPDPGPGAPPDPERMEALLRRGLAALDPQLGALAGTYRQAPVSFCVGGEPLAGPLPSHPGLWAFTGFSGAFSRVPQAAGRLAAAMAAAHGPG